MLLQKLQTHLQTYQHQFYPAFQNRRNHISAGILVALYEDDDWTCILTQRSSKLKDHSGEICFPGGKQQKEDLSLQDTALREAKEEISLEGTIIGRLSSIPLYTSDFRLEPFVAIANTPLDQLQANEEVEHILHVSLKHILERPFLEGTPFSYQGKTLVSPHFKPHHLQKKPPTNQLTYGGTAIVLYELLEQISIITNTKIPEIRQIDWPRQIIS